MKTVIMIIVAIISIQGCSGVTKPYGRLGILTDFEKQNLTCREIDFEIARANGFIDQVEKESSEIDGRDWAAALSFSVDNALEKDFAIESATKRIDELNQLKKDKNCQVSDY
jgi:hypothetical protein